MGCHCSHSATSHDESGKCAYCSCRAFHDLCFRVGSVPEWALRGDSRERSNGWDNTRAFLEPGCEYQDECGCPGPAEGGLEVASDE